MFNSKSYDYDLLVIGSGAGGSVGAHFAVSLGKKVAIVERYVVGGECPNFACVPTKALLHAAEIYDMAQNGEDYGVKVTGVSFDYSKVREWKNLVVTRTGAAHGEESFKKDGLHLIKGTAKFVSDHAVEVDGKVISAGKFLIATGSTVFIPPIEGLKESGYITFKDAVDFKELPKTIFILGGGPIGCEFTQVFSTFGSKVILADTLDRLIAKEDTETSDLVKALFENKGVEVLTGIAVTKVENKAGKKVIHYTKGDQAHTVSADQILVATGKRAVMDFAPEKAGLKLDDKGRLVVDPYLQTNKGHIYAAGDVVGPWLFTHTGYYQSHIAVNNMFTRNKIKQNYLATPRCVFTKPEIASVGFSEADAKAHGIKVKVGIVAMAELGRSNTTNEFDGFVKVITDRNETIIGAAIVAGRAGEMIHELTLAVQLKLKASVLANMLHAYPTSSEAIKIACANLENR